MKELSAHARDLIRFIESIKRNSHWGAEGLVMCDECMRYILLGDLWLREKTGEQLSGACAEKETP